jgi:predicted phage baseplate assembly protein
MPIPSPILDDRSYQQLRGELVRRIPVYTPEWTDHNESDPGVTLLELFAFLGENLLFRFNQIPETTKLEFLRLLQVPMRPAQPARGMVAFSAKELPAGAGENRVDQGSEVRAGRVPFETGTEVVVWPVSARAIARASSPPPDDEESLDFAARAIDARGGLAPGERAVFYTSRAVPDDPAAPGTAPVDFRDAVDGMLWIAVMGSDEIRAALRGQVLNLGILLDEDISRPEDIAACADDAGRARSLPLEWQVSTGRLAGDVPTYRALACVGDTTRGLSDSGIVRLRLPRELTDMGAFPITDADLAGTGDLPPEIQDAKAAASVMFWIRAFRPRGAGVIGRISWIGANATDVVQTTSANPEFVGTGNAQADQRFSLVNRSVVEGTLELEVEEQGSWRAWQAVDGFQASREDDRHYVLDPEAGEVRFGNGVQGRAPQIGERIRTRGYRYGGGPDGNVPAKAVNKVDTLPGRRTEVKVWNPLPTRGGAPAETVEKALERVPGEVRRRDRTVTAGDFRELTISTHGAGVGRAECLPRFHPPTRQQEAAGVVTVVVWPRDDRAHPNAPMPDRTLIDQVCEWLNARRLVTTELYVVPPVYRKVAVSIGVHVKPGYGIEAVRSWVELVTRQYLAPLPPYGPEGAGWPLGRRVHGPELEAAALQVEGVEYLEGLTVARLADDGQSWVAGTVTLQLDEVPELVEITVVEGPPLDPGVLLAPPDTGSVPVPIPALREEC